MAMYEKCNEKVWLAPLSLLYYLGIHSFKHPIKTMVDPMRYAQRIGAETGNIEESLVCGLGIYFSQLEMKPLGELEVSFHELREQMSFYGFTNILNFSSPSFEAVHVLMGHKSMDSLKGYQESDALLFIFAQFYVMMLSFLFGDVEEAAKSSTHLRMVSAYPFGGIDASFIVFMDGLVAIQIARKTRKRRNLNYGIRKMRQIKEMAKHSPHLFLCRQYLLEAEIASVNGDSIAYSKYISAIAQARYSETIFVTALANELAGRYFLYEKNDSEIAINFFQEAIRVYDTWGAKAKVDHLTTELSKISEGKFK
jgi:hypothetical protein